MSYSGGAENKTILDLFSYYNQFHGWKDKVKRRFMKSSKDVPPVQQHQQQDDVTTPTVDDKSPAPKSRKQPVRERSIKRRFRKYATSNGVSSNNVVTTNKSNNNNNNNNGNDGSGDTTRSRRCKSMIELGDGSIANITFYDRGGGEGGGGCGDRKQRKPVRRSVSMKERILDTAGKINRLFASHWLPV